jgi:hypothetical protein
MKKAISAVVMMCAATHARDAVAGAGLDVGANLSFGNASGANPVGFGLGGRVSVSFGPDHGHRGYVGLAFEHYFGVAESRQPTLVHPPATVTAHDRWELTALEGGVVFALPAHLTIRPSLQLGQVSEHVESSCSAGCNLLAVSRDHTYVLLAPGIEVGFHGASIGVRYLGAVQTGEASETKGVGRGGYALFLAYDLRVL